MLRHPSLCSSAPRAVPAPFPAPRDGRFCASGPKSQLVSCTAEPTTKEEASAFARGCLKQYEGSALQLLESVEREKLEAENSIPIKEKLLQAKLLDLEMLGSLKSEMSAVLEDINDAMEKLEEQGRKIQNDFKQFLEPEQANPSSALEGESKSKGAGSPGQDSSELRSRPSCSPQEDPLARSTSDGVPSKSSDIQSIAESKPSNWCWHPVTARLYYHYLMKTSQRPPKTDPPNVPRELQETASEGRTEVAHDDSRPAKRLRTQCGPAIAAAVTYPIGKDQYHSDNGTSPTKSKRRLPHA